ncbi:MAG TPA: glutathione transferase [Myxococcaceae bacterium]|nr:glutathione transferase [Myxococcaceae bacterium]
MADSITLFTDHYWISPYAFSAFVSLKEKGVAFEEKYVRLQDKEHLHAGYRDASITGRVPALRHGVFWLAESSAIAEYLEDVFPPPQYPRLYPEDLKQRAQARMIQAWIRSDLMPLREERSTASMFYEKAKDPLTAKGQAAADNLVRVSTLLIPDGATQLFATWSIADADLGFMLHRLILNGHEVPAKARKFADAQWQRPSVKEWVSQKRPPYVPYG